MKLPGGLEFCVQQGAPSAERGAPEEPTESIRQLANALVKSEIDKATAQQDCSRLVKMLEQARGAALYWEFAHLSLFLVPKTQWVLSWIAGSEVQVTRNLFESVWPLWNFGDVAERDAVYAALLGNGLIAQHDAILEVTQKGRAFLQFMGTRYHTA